MSCDLFWPYSLLCVNSLLGDNLPQSKLPKCCLFWVEGMLLYSRVVFGLLNLHVKLRLSERTAAGRSFWMLSVFWRIRSLGGGGFMILSVSLKKGYIVMGGEKLGDLRGRVLMAISSLLENCEYFNNFSMLPDVRRIIVQFFY